MPVDKTKIEKLQYGLTKCFKMCVGKTDNKETCTHPTSKAYFQCSCNHVFHKVSCPVCLNTK